MIILVPKIILKNHHSWGGLPLEDYSKGVLSAILAFPPRNPFLVRVTEGIRVNIVTNIFDPKKIGIFHIDDVNDMIKLISTMSLKYETSGE